MNGTFDKRTFPINIKIKDNTRNILKRKLSDGHKYCNIGSCILKKSRIPVYFLCTYDIGGIFNNISTIGLDLLVIF